MRGQRGGDVSVRWSALCGVDVCGKTIALCVPFRSLNLNFYWMKRIIITIISLLFLLSSAFPSRITLKGASSTSQTRLGKTTGREDEQHFACPFLSTSLNNSDSVVKYKFIFYNLVLLLGKFPYWIAPCRRVCLIGGSVCSVQTVALEFAATYAKLNGNKILISRYFSLGRKCREICLIFNWSVCTATSRAPTDLHIFAASLLSTPTNKKSKQN